MNEKTNIPGANRLKDIEHLKQLFPDGKADFMNFCLFSTSGVHGTYCTIEDLFGNDDRDEITVLVIRPRIVHMIYGHIKVEKSDIDYLKRLRESSHIAIQQIGRSD